MSIADSDVVTMHVDSEAGPSLALGGESSASPAKRLKSEPEKKVKKTKMQDFFTVKPGPSVDLGVCSEKENNSAEKKPKGTTLQDFFKPLNPKK